MQVGTQLQLSVPGSASRCCRVAHTQMRRWNAAACACYNSRLGTLSSTSDWYVVFSAAPLLAGRMYARPVVHTARTPNAAGGKTAEGKAAGKGSSTSSDGAGASSSQQPAAAGSSSGAGSSSACAGASSSRGRQGADSSAAAASSSVAPWLDDEFDDDDDDFTLYESSGYSRGGAEDSRQGDRSCSGSRSRSRMIKPQRKVPKGAAVTPAVASAACPVVNTPLGRSPCNGGFHCGSWGATGKSPNSGGGWAAAAAGLGTPGTGSSSSQAAGSVPGSGRRARRNARRAALDLGDYD